MHRDTREEWLRSADPTPTGEVARGRPGRRATLRVTLRRLALCTAIAGALLSGCNPGPKSGRGFRLPDGDPEIGRQVFASQSCTDCHRVAGEDLGESDPSGPVSITLGGRTTRVRSYGELVTSVINPSHRIAPNRGPEAVTPQGDSVMPNYNSVLTVQELVDIVAFLQGTYEVVPPAYEYHSYY